MLAVVCNFFLNQVKQSSIFAIVWNCLVRHSLHFCVNSVVFISNSVILTHFYLLDNEHRFIFFIFTIILRLNRVGLDILERSIYPFSMSYEQHKPQLSWHNAEYAQFSILLIIPTLNCGNKPRHYFTSLKKCISVALSMNANEYELWHFGVKSLDKKKHKIHFCDNFKSVNLREIIDKQIYACKRRFNRYFRRPLATWRLFYLLSF